MAPETMPAQEQGRQPGIESEMTPEPKVLAEWYRGSGKLEGRRALITGGDSGIGRSIAILFAREGATVGISYLDEHDDAERTKELVEAEGATCTLYPGDIGRPEWAHELVQRFVDDAGGLDILVNNAAEQHVAEELREIDAQQIQRTFDTNVFAMFHLAQEAIPHLTRDGACIINTASVVAFKGKPVLVDYSATKGAIVAFTRSLALQLAEQGIRVNAVAPGPIWTPLIPATFDEESVAEFGGDTPLGRPGQPEEVAPAYVYLASRDSSYVTGQVVHVNGGEVVGS